MMLKFFDYVYYRTYLAYRNQDNMPYMYAIGLVALMQQFNLVTIYFWADVLFGFELVLNKYVKYGSFLIFIVPNYIRYTRVKDFNKLSNIWENENDKDRIRNGGIVLGYVILSVILLIVSAQITGIIERGEFK
jgi:hypothetical protein